jgi:hypothetical protein
MLTRTARLGLILGVLQCTALFAAEKCSLKAHFQPQPSATRITTADSVCSAGAGPLAYVMEVDPGFKPNFGLMDIGMGKFYPLAKLADNIQALAGSQPGLLYTVDFDANLYQVNPVTGKSALIGPTGITTPGLPGYNIDVIASTADGTLYAMDFNNNLFSLDRQSGAATLIGSTGISPLNNNHHNYPTSFAGDCQYLYFTLEDLDERLAIAHPAVLYRIDPKTASSTVVGPVQDYIVGSGFVNGKFYVFTLDYTSSGLGPQSFIMDPATGISTLLANQSNIAGLYGAIALGAGNSSACGH